MSQSLKPDPSPARLETRRARARRLDQLLGSRAEEIEAALQENRARKNAQVLPQGEESRLPVQDWVGKELEVFQTPDDELAEILTALELPHGARLVDLGSGYGRLGRVCRWLRPDLRFLGLELVAERVEESRRMAAELERVLAAIPNPERAPDMAGPANPVRDAPSGEVRFLQADLATCPLPEAEAYFVFDFGSREAVSRVLEELKTQARARAFFVAARGGLIRNLIEREHPWLTPILPPGRLEFATVYRSA